MKLFFTRGTIISNPVSIGKVIQVYPVTQQINHKYDPVASLLPRCQGGREANAKAVVYQISESLGVLGHESVNIVEYYQIVQFWHKIKAFFILTHLLCESE